MRDDVWTYTCDRCPAKVPLKRSVYLQLPRSGAGSRRVFCDECLEKMDTPIRRSFKAAPKRISSRTACRCGKQGPVLHTRLDSRNWRETCRVLCCRACGEEAGLQPVDFVRAEGTFPY